MEVSVGSGSFWLMAFIGFFGIVQICKNSHALIYRLKFIIFLAHMSLVTLCMIPFIIFTPKDVTNFSVGAPWVMPVNRLLGIKWEVSGGEILAKDFACVVICNHQSALDALGMIELWYYMRKFACVAKRELMFLFPFGLTAWLCGTVFINRRNPGESQIKISTSAENIRNNKIKLWIYPEGTRSMKEELLPFKKGAFHLAVQSKLPIVPVVFSPYSFIDSKKKTFGSGTMKVKVFEPIDTSNLSSSEDISELVERCYGLMNSEYGKMRRELQTPENMRADKSATMTQDNAKDVNENKDEKASVYPRKSRAS